MIKVARKTNETDIQVGLNLYGTGQAKIDTGVPCLAIIRLLVGSLCFDINYLQVFFN
jgi:imidazoleglycerol phosphate dehydratase HisB